MKDRRDALRAVVDGPGLRTARAAARDMTREAQLVGDLPAAADSAGK